MSRSADDIADRTEEQSKPRDPTERPVYKLSVKLIDTYKHINKIYYEAKAKRLREQADVTRGGVYNDGYDDVHYDYILHGDEIFAERYILKHRIGKGSFGQVVCAYDKEAQCEVAIKIIKSRKPFMLQAQTEIDLLTLLLERDPGDENNIVTLLNKFVYRNHQCIVFEMLSYNLYELLKNTRFKGVSLNLIRKFSKQILRALEFLASPDVDVIHCDLKPENILLRHPRRSAIKLIDFGSSCQRTKRVYTYIQSRFYRAPEILLGLPYDQKIDIWSLGCVLVEMHTGEPLFGGVDQADQICRIIDVLGMPPFDMLEQCPCQIRDMFFQRIEYQVAGSGVFRAVQSLSASSTPSPLPSSECDLSCTSSSQDGRVVYYLKRSPRQMVVAAVSSSVDPVITQTHSDASASSSTSSSSRRLENILGVSAGGPSGRRKGEAGHSQERYMEFLDFIKQMLVYLPAERASATQSLQHPYIHQQAASSYSQGAVSGAPMDADGGAVAVSSGTATHVGDQQADISERGSPRGIHQRGRTHMSVDEANGYPRIRSQSAPTSSRSRINSTDDALTSAAPAVDGGANPDHKLSIDETTQSMDDSSAAAVAVSSGRTNLLLAGEAEVVSTDTGSDEDSAKRPEKATTMSARSKRKPA